MLENKELRIRAIIVGILVIANPLIFWLMKLIAWLQRQTFASFIILFNRVEPWFNIKMNLLYVVAIAQLFWPIVFALPVNHMLHTKFNLPSHRYIYLCFFWIIFNGGFILFRQG